MSEQMHKLNIRYPWLKVVALLALLIGTAVGVEELLRCSIPRPHDSGVAAVALLTKIPDPEVILALDTEGEAALETALLTDMDDQSQQTSTEDGQKISEGVATEIEESVAVDPVVPTTQKLIALTFDDGPSRTETVRLLQILAERNVNATFFVIGTNAERMPEILQQVKAAGHEIGSHTMTHANLARSTVEAIRWEVAAMDGVFVSALGEKPYLMRPPYGSISDAVRENVAQPLILWTVDPEDWKVRDAATVRSRAVAAAFDGAIILFHDIYASTVDAIPGVIDDLRAQGYEFVTVSELAAARGVQLQNGVSYGSFRP